MYREVLEAFAAGDVETIQRLCTPSYAQRLIAAVTRRDPREEVHFEVVKYHQPWRFPKLKSHQIRAANELEQDQLTEQAVVAISSTQRLTRKNKVSGQIVPGSTKVQDKVEFVVLARNMDKKTWEMEPWRIWGTISDTPLEKYLAEKTETEEKQDQHVKWKNSTSR
jgi:protein MBA1